MQSSIQSNKSSINQQESNEKVPLEGRWNKQEHLQFLKAVLVYGKDWKKVEEAIKYRTGSQVRSHAQKYFLKIFKINKQRRRHKNKPFQLSQTQQEIINLFTQEDITQNSPIELVSIIKKQFNQPITSNILKLNKEIPQKCKNKQHKEEKNFPNKQLNESEYQEVTNRWKNQNQQQKFNDILENLQKFQDYYNQQDQSLFIKLFKRNMDHFKNGGDFTDLIDYGKSVIENQETSPRKCSFVGQQIQEQEQDNKK